MTREGTIPTLTPHERAAVADTALGLIRAFSWHLDPGQEAYWKEAYERLCHIAGIDAMVEAQHRAERKAK